jgi:hypothetical protein
MTPVACGRGCRVDRCDHGTLHLTIGDVTLRISPSGLGTLADTLAHAQLALGRPDAESLPC